MNKYIITTLSLLLVFTLIASATTPILSKEATRTVISKQLIKSEYGPLGDMFGIGDRLYQLTYDNGITEYKLERTSFLRPAFITSISNALSVPVNGYIDIPITITGVSSVMDGQSSHDHVIRVYDSADSLVTNRQYNVNSGKTLSATLQLGTKDTSGVYTYRVKETVWVVLTLSTGEKLYTEASGDTAYVTVTVGGSQSLVMTEVDLVNNDDKSRSGFMVGREIIVFLYTNLAADGNIIVKDNDVLINTFYVYKGIGLSGWYYKFTSPGIHKICASASNSVCKEVTVSTTPGQTTPPISDKCPDGMSYNACSSQKPLYCYYGSLINKASQCGCPSGQSPSGDNCIAAEQKCSDGTAYNTCSTNKPKYCYYGTLTDKASQCGCPFGSTQSGDICIGTLTPVATTPAPTIPGTTPSPCLTGYVYDPSTDSCVKIQSGLPGFEAIFAITGLIITTYIVLRKKKL